MAAVSCMCPCSYPPAGAACLSSAVFPARSLAHSNQDKGHHIHLDLPTPDLDPHSTTTFDSSKLKDNDDDDEDDSL